MKLLYVTGWAHAAQSLAPLAAAVQAQLPQSSFELLAVDQLFAALPQEARISHVAGQLAAHINQHQPQVVVAWSLGAMVALEAVVDCDLLLDRLVLISPTHCFVQSEQSPYGVPALELRRLQRRLDANRDVALRGFYELCAAPQQDSANVEQLLEQQRSVSLSVLQSGLEYLEQKNLYQNLSEVVVPSLILYGSADAVISPQASRMLGKLLRQPACECADVGHALAMQQPDVVATHIAEFVQK